MKRLLFLPFLAVGCMQPPTPPLRFPAQDYADRVLNRENQTNRSYRKQEIVELDAQQADPRAQLSMNAVNPQGSIIEHSIDQTMPLLPARTGMNESGNYRDPLELGNPGASPSLWRESRGYDLFHDLRAWQPMDLVTILITENAEAKSEADTKLNRTSTLEAAITKFFGVEKWAKELNQPVEPAALIGAESTSEFDGKGSTTRKGRIRATISAMVVEVLPSGILRIEGQKIISTNAEEETLVLSGLIRTRDINSNNEIDSKKIANMRIDYMGDGSVGGQQHQGWASRIFNAVWPF